MVRGECGACEPAAVGQPQPAAMPPGAPVWWRSAAGGGMAAGRE